MNLEGRPDGKRPNGFESFYEFLLSRLDEHVMAHGTDDSFKLSPDACTRLHLEALQYHHRYICLLQLEEHQAVETRLPPQPVRVRLRRALCQLRRDGLEPAAVSSTITHDSHPGTRDPPAPRQASKQSDRGDRMGIQMLNEFYTEMDRQDLRDHSLEIESLENWLTEVKSIPTSRRKLSKREQLEQQLSEAVSNEEYERAARIRDQIRSLRVKAPKKG